MTMENLSLKSPSLLNPARCEGTLHCTTVTLIVPRTISQAQNVAAGWSKEKCSGTRNILHSESILQAVSICSVDDVCWLNHWILMLVVLFLWIFFFIHRKKTDGSIAVLITKAKCKNMQIWIQIISHYSTSAIHQIKIIHKIMGIFQIIENCSWANK